ncbi:MAG TPA: site-2 protease family protein [Bryobacteraceae bacterium]|nr:site-2 protease family protein [Bryobacteraceae bacterium]
MSPELPTSETAQAVPAPAEEPRFCFACGSPLPAGALNCPACRQLVHAADLEQLAIQARAQESAGDLAAAADLWQKALALLPLESQQAASIRDHVDSLGPQARIAAQPPDSSANGSAAGSGKSAPNWKKRLGPIGVVLAFLAKFKTGALILLTKGKFLLLGLTKMSTLLSMFASMGLYWALYGWKLAAGFVLGIYVHEMGHVWALRHFGLRASAPMFIPGFGAFVSLYDSPANASEDARIGLAGPIWGTGAALACLLPWIVTQGGLWLAVAHTLAYINLFNLTPVWQLDGGRGFRALDRQQRLLSLGLMLVLWYFAHAGMLLILAAGAAYRVLWSKDHPMEGDRGAFLQYAGLLVMLGAMLAWIR